MKEITILQENAPQIILEDSDESDANIVEYMKKISSILKSNNVTILHLSSGSVVLRPNKITSIVVKEFPTTTDLSLMQPQVESKEEKSETTEDTITD